MSVAKSPKEVYQQFIDFEDKAADIYLRLASRFASYNHELSAFWLNMAMEEKQHSVLLHFCLAEKWFSQSLPGEGEIRKYVAMFNQIEKRAADPAITTDDAFAIAAELEGSEVNAIYCHLTTPLHVSRYLLQKKMATAPFDHVNGLAAAGRKFKASAATVKKLDQLKQSCLRVWRHSA